MVFRKVISTFREGRLLDLFEEPDIPESEPPKRITRASRDNHNDGRYEDEYDDDYDDDRGYRHRGRGGGRGSRGGYSGYSNDDPLSDPVDTLMEKAERWLWKNLRAKFWSLLRRLAGNRPLLVNLLAAPVIFYFVWTGLWTRMPKLTRWLLTMFGMASQTLDPNDQLYWDFRAWMSRKRLLQDARTSFAFSTAYVDEQRKMAATHKITTTAEAEAAVSFIPVNSTQTFTHSGRLFIVTTPESRADEPCSMRGQSLVPETSPVTIWRLGWSEEPIKRLLDQIYIPKTDTSQLQIMRPNIVQDQKDKTKIYASWILQMQKPPRSIESVHLKASEKDNVVEDLAEYRDPDTKRWYQELSVPYKRSYLFYGEPGCGKTSFVEALAGRFNLRILTLSLLDPNLTDELLMALFKQVREGDLILMEDVDSAGVGRELAAGNKAAENKDSSSEDGSDTSSSSSDDSKLVASRRRKAKAKSKKAKKAKKEEQSNVTFSGLLNALDGVASPQGHVVVMTTNHRERLDPALIRAGRVNIQVYVTYADRDQAESMFKYMYTPRPYSHRMPPYPVESIPMLAKAFADKLPTGIIAPGDIQDYIFHYRVNPKAAVADADRWVEYGLLHGFRKSGFQRSSTKGLEISDGVSAISWNSSPTTGSVSPTDEAGAVDDGTSNKPSTLKWGQSAVAIPVGW